MTLCELVKVTKTYAAGETISPIQGLDLVIPEGTFVSIQGESGIGKSTLLMMLGGLMKPTSGTILFRNNPIGELTDDQLTEWRGKYVGYLFQHIQLVQALTVEENILLAKRFSRNGHKKDPLNIEALLDRLGLAEKRDSLPCQLSGGQRRRVMIAVTWVRNPELILADEPTNDLDDFWAEKVMDIFAEWVDSGKAVVLATHHGKWANKAMKKYKIQNRVLAEC